MLNPHIPSRKQTNAQKLKQNEFFASHARISNFSLKCLVGELFVIEEGEWSPPDYPAREEVVNMAIRELGKLPFNFEVVEVERVVKIEK
jgi:hypothetical protein